MKSVYVFLSAVLLTSTTVFAHTTNTQVYNVQGNGNTITGGSQTGVQVKTNVKVSRTRRGLRELFRRDPQLAMEIYERDLYERASQYHTVEDIANAIMSNSIDKEIEAAAKAQGWVEPKGVKVTRRSPAKTAGKSQQIPPSKAVPGKIGDPMHKDDILAHIKSGNPFPQKIIDALNKMGWKKGGKGGAAGGAAGKAMSAIKSAGASVTKALGGGKKTKSRRSFEQLYARDFDFDGIYAREAEPALTLERLEGLVHAMSNSREAEIDVLKALSSDPAVEKVTEELADRWVEKRDAAPEPEPEYEGLDARDAEPEYEYDF